MPVLSSSHRPLGDIYLRPPRWPGISFTWRYHAWHRGEGSFLSAIGGQNFENAEADLLLAPEGI